MQSFSCQGKIFQIDAKLIPRNTFLTDVIITRAKKDENDIALKGLNASRHHAVIKYQQGQYIISPLSAGNPITINGNPVNQATALRDGDIIKLGESVFRFEAR